MINTILRGRVRQPRRCLLYGVAGVGKTTLSAAARDPIFIQVEDGLADVGADRFPLATSFADVVAQIKSLVREPHEYQTVVVDSIDWLERHIFAEVTSERNVRSIEEIGYGKGYVFALDLWRRFLTGLDLLRRDRGMSAVLVAHSAIVRFEDPSTEAYDRFQPRLHKAASALVTEWSDEVLFASYKIRTRTVGDGFDKRVKGIGTGERTLYATERPSHLAKNRCGLADEIEFDPDLFARIVAGEVSTESTREDNNDG